MKYQMRYRQGLYDESFEKDACGIGFILNAQRPAQHEIVQKGLEILAGLSHRSALGADNATSDGAGLMLQIPDLFLRQELKKLSLTEDLPPPGQYALGQIFSPPGFFAHTSHWTQLQLQAQELGFRIFCLRQLKVDSQVLGEQAKSVEPDIHQIILVPESGQAETQVRNLFLFRRRSESLFRQWSGCLDPMTGKAKSQFYFCSLSFETVIYKGLMQPKDLGRYYVDLQDPLMVSQLAIVHSRFSTNTLPAWELAQPFRYSCHNGEINTIKGNRHWMKAREKDFWRQMRLSEEAPLLSENRSDSTSLDEALELLLMRGYSLTQAMMILIPEPWEDSSRLCDELKDFYQYYSLRMEAWDGPAALCFSDGPFFGARLDRNGLRPFRFQLLKNGTLMGGSEAGVLPVADQEIRLKGRLKPGQILLVDLRSGRMDLNDESKSVLAKTKDIHKLLKAEILKPQPIEFAQNKRQTLDWKNLLRFGYHYDEILQVLLPMLKDGEEAISSMGADTSLALLNNEPQLLDRYFRQMFAQVTNPPIDPIREKSVMSLMTFVGSKPSPFQLESDGKKRILFSHPLVSPQQLHGLKIETLDGSFEYRSQSLQERLVSLQAQAEFYAQSGAEVLILSDEKCDTQRAAIPSLLLVSAIHSHLIRKQLRLRLSLLVDSAELRNVHQMACLLSFGADALNPRIVPDLILELQKQNLIPQSLSTENVMKNYQQAVQKGLLKILSKLGISTLQSYKGAQTFEILGLGDEVVSRYFPGTVSRIGGLNLEQIAEEVKRRWENPLIPDVQGLWDLPSRGDVHYRSQGEHHQWNPMTIAKLQIASRNQDIESYQEFSKLLQESDRGTLRGALKWKKVSSPLELSQVEEAESIVRRFTTGAMSLGALSSEAHETLAIAMNRIQAKSNSGEGGEDPRRFQPLANGDQKNSAIKQIASARFGVTTDYLTSAKELQIKMAQGAKPGEGGQLPGAKVDAEIARIRHSIPGVTLISPPPHHDIYSIEDLAQLIHDLKSVHPEAVISVKLVSEAGVGTVAAGVAKAKAQKILISGDGGGTGASPLSSIQSAGVPWELGLAEAHQTLTRNGLRSRVRLEADGQLRSGRDVALAAALGADEFGFATAPLIVQGCTMMRKCHLNTCPVGIATQDPELRQKFSGLPEHVVNYFFFVAEELRQIMASLGIAKVEDLIGRSDLLDFEAPSHHWKGKSLDLSRLLERASELEFQSAFAKTARKLVHFSESFDFAIQKRISTRDRAVGSGLSGERSRLKRQKHSLSPAEHFLMGSAGQSFGAFLGEGLTLRLVGEANDYVGKGLSGGNLVIRFSPDYQGESLESILVGNTCLYGATSGKAFFAGGAGERFAVRNSGALSVVEAIGDHGCEYMTGGAVVVLSTPGFNFAAGMSGGVAFIYDEEGLFLERCNRGLVEIENHFNLEDEKFLFELLSDFANETESKKAQLILSNWQAMKSNFVKVIPSEYKKAKALAKNNLRPAMESAIL